ncbi:hypothetical protein M404DRAFT_36621 [Pisolithus tinctorius Marx 270]|uniref:Uncharacterized protein n=1 Tax=Pisolithus tinctorius Marx 270 TaxID=870435 RepID=A0A0C3I6T3_PISTI|nr:hypothetical protein M404DRAFT_172378 [Pisolithus tinctorius Marx 270]KIN92897.1 hypothetical protein M404DRAFT_36621 [Pisolithus tinctorius Marx 270]
MGKFDHIPELTDASTFFAWKTQVLLALDCEGAYSHVSDGTDPLDPIEFASVKLKPAKPAKLTDDEQKVIVDWSKADAVAKDVLCQHLSLAVLRLIPQERPTTARDVWIALHDNFDHVDVGSQHLVWARILHMHMKDASDAACYLSEHSAARCDLIHMGVSYSDEEAIFHLIEGLPETGTWLSFRLFLQSSCTVAAAASVGTSVSSTSKTSASTIHSSISTALSMSLVTFESVSVKIVAEAHCFVQQLSFSSMGSEYTNATTSPVGPPNVNPETGLWKTCNNPSGTYCDTPIGEGLVCGASNHDKAHCFKPGGGMAGQQPSWWKGKGDKEKDKLTSATVITASTPTAPAPPASTSILVAAAALDSSAASPWTTHSGDLTCTVITELDEGVDAPTLSPALKACLGTLSASSLLDSGTSCMLVCNRAFF